MNNNKLTKSVLFRMPVSEDAEEMVAFYNRVGGETTFLSFEKDEYPLDKEAQKENIRSMNQHPACTVILAVDQEQIIGIGTITSGNKKKSRHCGELGIVVTNAYQGFGIGTALMTKLLEFCRGNGITTKVRLDVSADNKTAIQLYRKFGFEKEGTIRNATLIDDTYYDLDVMGRMV